MFDLISTGNFELPCLVCAENRRSLQSPAEIMLGFHNKLTQMGYGDLLVNLLPGFTPFCEFEPPQKPTMLQIC